MATTWRLIETGPCYPSQSAARARTKNADRYAQPAPCKGCPACGVKVTFKYAPTERTRKTRSDKGLCRVCRNPEYVRVPGDPCLNPQCPSNETKAYVRKRYAKGGGNIDGKPLGGGRAITVNTHHGYHDYLVG